MLEYVIIARYDSSFKININIFENLGIYVELNPNLHHNYLVNHL
jgi:hypothetical protein